MLKNEITIVITKLVVGKSMPRDIIRRPFGAVVGWVLDDVETVGGTD